MLPKHEYGKNVASNDDKGSSIAINKTTIMAVLYMIVPLNWPAGI